MKKALIPGLLALCAVVLSAQPPVPTVQLSAARPIAPPEHLLPAEEESASTTRFSFIAYGATRGLADGLELQTAHTTVVDAMIGKIQSLAATPFPVRFVVQSGDAVASGRDGKAWNVSFTDHRANHTRRRRAVLLRRRQS
jgi:hypothetical protein